MWLLRGLKFTAKGLRSSVNNPSEELSVSFTKGYEESLKKWHGMMVRPVFYVRLLDPVLLASISVFYPPSFCNRITVSVAGPD